MYSHECYSLSDYVLLSDTILQRNFAILCFLIMALSTMFIALFTITSSQLATLTPLSPSHHGITALILKPDEVVVEISPPSVSKWKFDSNETGQGFQMEIDFISNGGWWDFDQNVTSKIKIQTHGISS